MTRKLEYCKTQSYIEPPPSAEHAKAGRIEMASGSTKFPAINPHNNPRNTKSNNELVLVIPDETKILKNLKLGESSIVSSN